MSDATASSNERRTDEETGMVKAWITHKTSSMGKIKSKEQHETNYENLQSELNIHEWTARHSVYCIFI